MPRFDDVITAILGGSEGLRRKRQQAIDDLALTQQYGADPNTLIRGQALTREGRTLPPPTVTMLPQPSPAASQFAPRGHQQPQGGPLVPPAMVGGGQGPANLPLSQPGMPPQDMRALGVYGEFLQRMQGLQSLKGKVAQTQLEDIKSQTDLRESQADYYRNKLNAGTGGSPNLDQAHMAALRYGVETGILAPSEMTYRGPKTMILSEGIMQRPDFQQWYASQGNGAADPLAEQFNPMQADARLSGIRSEVSGLGAARGKATQTVGQNVQSMNDTLDLLKPVIPNIPSAGLRTMTAALRRGDLEINDPNLIEAYGYLTSLKGFYASMIHGGGVPDLKNEQDSAEAISKQIDQRGFPGLEKFLKNEGNVRIRGVRTGAKFGQAGMPSNTSHPQDSQAVAWAKSHPRDPRSKRILQVNGL